MSEIVTVYATFADSGEAKRVARAVVTERLAACANILGPCRSIYWWQGAVAEGLEVPALFKTSTSQAEVLIARIADLHSYDVPAAVVWPITAALPAYTGWIEAETGAQDPAPQS